MEKKSSHFSDITISNLLQWTYSSRQLVIFLTKLMALTKVEEDRDAAKYQIPSKEK